MNKVMDLCSADKKFLCDDPRQYVTFHLPALLKTKDNKDTDILKNAIN